MPPTLNPIIPIRVGSGSFQRGQGVFSLISGAAGLQGLRLVCILVLALAVVGVAVGGRIYRDAPSFSCQAFNIPSETLRLYCCTLLHMRRVQDASTMVYLWHLGWKTSTPSFIPDPAAPTSGQPSTPTESLNWNLNLAEWGPRESSLSEPRTDRRGARLLAPGRGPKRLVEAPGGERGQKDIYGKDPLSGNWDGV